METMHYNEKKKSSKGIVISLVLFCLLGVGIIVVALKNEPEPVIMGKDKSDIQQLVDLGDNDSKATMAQNKNINYEIKDKAYNDKSNVKIKSDMTLPIISVNGEELNELNSKIDEEYTKLFNGFKEQMATADSKYTYKVSYNVYDNMVGTDKILSITIWQRMQDDSAKKNSMEKIQSINIDLSTKKTVTEYDIAMEILGKDYMSKIKTVLKDYVVSKNMMKEEDFVYALTGLENFYVKDSKFHIMFNNGELVDSKYGILDITIE